LILRLQDLVNHTHVTQVTEPFSSPDLGLLLSTTMFALGRQLLGTAQSCLRKPSTSRFFSSSPVNELYKMKTHSGARKRWRPLASGSSFKRVGRLPNAFYIYHTHSFLISALQIIGKGRALAYERLQKRRTEKQTEHDCIFDSCSNAQAQEGVASRTITYTVFVSIGTPCMLTMAYLSPNGTRRRIV
jgi:hypothetical protein